MSMAETTTMHENLSVSLSNNQNHESNSDVSDRIISSQNSPLTAESTSISNNTTESTSISNNTTESSKPSIQIQTNHSTFNQSSNDMSSSMSKLSVHGNRSRPNPSTSYRHQPSSSSQFTSSINQPDTQAQLIAFTPPLMSIQLPYQESQIRQRNYHSTRPYIPNEPTVLPSKNKSETTVSQPEYYVDSFASNFSDKPSSNSNNTNTKTKTKHVTFQEPDRINQSSKTNSNHTVFPPASSNGFNYPSSNWTPSVPMHPNSHSFHRYNHPANYYPYHEFYPPYSNMMMNPRFMAYPPEMNMISRPPVWSSQPYYPHQQMSYLPNPTRPRQLYDPNQPKIPSTIESHDSSKVLRHIVPKNKKKSKQTNSDDSSTVSTPEPIAHPFTILRKPSVDPEMTTPLVENRPTTPVEEQEQIPMPSSTEEQSPITSSEEEQITIATTDNQSEPNPTISLPSHELLAILQSANCISSLNEYAQQKKFQLNYEFSIISPSSFTCTMSINDRQFPTSSPCTSKNEAQKLACDQAVRILYRESCPIEQSSLKFSSNHDYIAHRSVSAFQDLNVNELLLGRKTLACMLMTTDQQFAQARVISIATGNSCLDETNLSYADDGTVLHDCHAEILARRGLIKFLFEEIKRCKDHHSSIFEYNSTTNKYQLHDTITFHMYISSLPCGNAALNIPSNSLRYKQGQTEGTHLASSSSIKYPIKSCSDKIYRWNILGIQGGLLIHLLPKPIYLQTITIACETTFDRTRVIYSLCERLKEHLHSLPSPFSLHMPDIDCPKTKSFQQERQVAKLQTNAFAWNTIQSDRLELLEPMTGRLKNDRSTSSLSKQNLLQDFLNILPDNSLTYQQAKQLDKTYIMVKNLISIAFQTGSSDGNIAWISKSDQLEQFSKFND